MGQVILIEFHNLKEGGGHTAKGEKIRKNNFIPVCHLAEQLGNVFVAAELSPNFFKAGKGLLR